MQMQSPFAIQTLPSVYDCIDRMRMRETIALAKGKYIKDATSFSHDSP
jgi:hypothetical protein